MGQLSATKRRSRSRTGRPPLAAAGEVDGRILDAARKVFLKRGFEGATIDEIADVARAGKPTIYARYPGKKALFAAVVVRSVAANTRFDNFTPTGATSEKRLTSLGIALLRRILAETHVALIRSTVAEARRFPDLASSVHRMARERGGGAVAALLHEMASADGLGALPAFSPERLPTTTRYFLDLAILPLLMRALLGENLRSLRTEIDGHVARAANFFLAACRAGVTRPAISPCRSPSRRSDGDGRPAHRRA